MNNRLGPDPLLVKSFIRLLSSKVISTYIYIVPNLIIRVRGMVLVSIVSYLILGSVDKGL